MSPSSCPAWLRFVVLFALVFGGVPVARALTLDQALSVVVGDNNSRVEAIRGLGASGDPAAAALLKRLQDGALRHSDGRVFWVDGARVSDAVTGEQVSLPSGAEEPLINNRLRREIGSAIGMLALVSGERAQRLAAAQSLL